MRIFSRLRSSHTACETHYSTVTLGIYRVRPEEDLEEDAREDPADYLRKEEMMNDDELALAKLQLFAYSADQDTHTLRIASRLGCPLKAQDRCTFLSEELLKRPYLYLRGLWDPETAGIDRETPTYARSGRVWQLVLLGQFRPSTAEADTLWISDLLEAAPGPPDVRELGSIVCRDNGDEIIYLSYIDAQIIACRLGTVEGYLRPVHSEGMSLRTTSMALPSEISELRAADQRRQTVISELLKTDYRRQRQLAETLKIVKSLKAPDDRATRTAGT
ncbi:hypothetical protein Tco_1111236 [Tanacetum coccineum]|uniref:Uncharacterized protein n=1 Tax=Tanacetum coccineum TaxID=301880 RepID=A0ABQ5INJ0_9ASTR